MLSYAALGLARFAPIDNPATVNNHAEVLTAIFIILALLLVLLIAGLGVTLARRPGKQLDEWGNPTGGAGTPPN